MVDAIYDNFKFVIKENSYDDDFIDIYWGTDKNGTAISVPVDRVDELASSIYEFLDNYEDDYDAYDDMAVCAFCGNYYCTCCGCDCMMYDEDGEDYD